MEIITSIDDKKLIIDLAGYLDETSQVDGLSNALKRLYINEGKEPEEGTAEREFIERGGIFEEKKQIIYNRQKQEEIDEKDKNIIADLESIRKNGYRKMPSWEIAQKICELSTDEKKISAMDKYFREIVTKLRGTEKNDGDNGYSLLMGNEFDSIATVIKTMNTDKSKQYVMQEYLEKSFKYYQKLFTSLGMKMEHSDIWYYEKCKYTSIMSLKDKTSEVEKLKQSGKYDSYLDFIKNEYELELEGTSLIDIFERGMNFKTDEEKEDYLKTGDAYKIAIITEDSLETQNNVILGYLDIICSMDIDENKLKLYHEIIEPLKDYYMSKNDNPKRLALLENTFNYTLLKIINSFKDKSKMIDTYAEQGILEQYLKYDYFNEDKGEIVQDNIEKILGYLGIDDIQAKKEMLERMSLSNSRVYELIDFRFLDNKLTSVFSENEINILTIQPEYYRDMCCELDDNQLKFAATIIRNVENEDDFGEYFCNIIPSLRTYDELISNIDYETLTEEQQNKLKTLVQYKNIFDIKTIEDIDNFDAIKEAKLREIMESESSLYPKKSEIIEKKNALLLKMYGIDYDTACKFIIEFNELEPNDPKLQMIRQIVSLDETYPGVSETAKLLKSIYEDERIQEKKVPLINKINARKEYIAKYEKSYNDVLYKPEDGVFLEEKDGIKFYDMGTDFSILTTSVGAFSRKNETLHTENEQESWNRKDLASNHFCGSFSTDEMIGMIMTEDGVYYGFSSIEQGSMLFMATEDSQSYSSSLGSQINGTRSFRFPNSMVDKTGLPKNGRHDLYNEIDIKRRTKNVQKEPDYIIAIKVDGKIINEETAIKAAKDWKGKKTVQVLDVDKCLEKSKENLNKVISEYKQNPTKENLQKVWNVFHKTSITYGNFYAGKDKHPPFIETVDLPEELKKIINYDKDIAFYSLKSEIIPSKETPTEDITLSVNTLIDKIYGPRKVKTVNGEKEMKSIDGLGGISKKQTNEGDVQTEKQHIDTTGELADTGKHSLTFEEIGKDTVQTFKSNPREEMKFSKIIKRAIEKLKELSGR